jgi:hypothetical protein
MQLFLTLPIGIFAEVAASAVQRADRQFRNRDAEDGIIQEVLGEMAVWCRYVADAQAL